MNHQVQGQRRRRRKCSTSTTTTTLSKKQPPPEQNDNAPHIPTLAIIGASFAGLTCAHALLKGIADDNEQQVQVILIEEGPGDKASSYITNEIKLSTRANIILSKIIGISLSEDDRPEQRSALLKKMRSGIVTTRIRYATRVDSIVPQHHSSKSKNHATNTTRIELHLSSSSLRRDNNATSILCCDTVVVANGVGSLFRTDNNNHNNNIYVIGDARWVPDVWYHFGMSRLNRGASTAIEDGMELANYLLWLLQLKKQQQIMSNQPQLQGKRMERKYSSICIRRRVRIRRVFYFFVLMLIVLLQSSSSSLGMIIPQKEALATFSVAATALAILLRMRVVRRRTKAMD